ncbi:MAG: TrkH family potassium uptake protein [Candidatus Methanomethylophilaceae archaeon]|nr:TrkH family potassium uptake protein [Candidatus Methanomethylophilaceae archaeon]
MGMLGDRGFDRFARWSGTTVKIMGAVEVIIAGFLLIPAIAAIVLGEDPTPFLVTVPPLFIAGALQFVLFRESKGFRTVNGLLMIGLAWLLVFVLGTVPYVVSGMTPVDAFFESVSGFTTTGSTIMSDIESWPVSLLLWRSLSQWLGGIAVIIIFMYILPVFSVGRGFFLNELAGSGSSDYYMKMGNAAKSFIIVYCVLTFANFLLLVLCGVDLVDALCLMLTTISTGGLMCRNDSLTSFSDIVQIITIVFMFLGGVNFYLHYRALYRHSKRVYRGNSEFKTLTLWFITISVLVYVMIVANMGSFTSLDIGEHLEVFKNSLFTTVSLGTTTGFAVDDYTQYPEQCVMLLMIVAFFGASSGSTSGGVKFGRLRIIYEFLANSLRKSLRPNEVMAVKVDGKPVDDSAVMSALSIFLMYIVTMFAGAVVLMFFGMDYVDSFGLTISAVSNVGIGFGNFGPTESYAILDPRIKMILCILMWLGRLEILVALTLFTPSFWREVWLNSRASRGARSRNRRMRRRHRV